MFKVKKPFPQLEVSYCEQNKIASKRCIKKFHPFTDEKYDGEQNAIRVNEESKITFH